MSLVVRAFPLLQPVDELKAFIQECSVQRKEDTARLYRRYGVSHESWYLQENPGGTPWVISVAVMDNPAEAGQQFSASDDAFDQWFQQRVLKLSGIDQKQQPLGPPTVKVFEWSDAARPNSNLCAL